MNKTDVIKSIAKEIGSSQKEVESMLNAFFETVGKALAKEEAVSFVGFGSFKVVKRAAKKGRNPRTGEEITIPASKVVKFIPGKNLKEQVN